MAHRKSENLLHGLLHFTSAQDSHSTAHRLTRSKTVRDFRFDFDDNEIEQGNEAEQSHDVDTDGSDKESINSMTTKRPSSPKSDSSSDTTEVLHISQVDKTQEIAQKLEYLRKAKHIHEFKEERAVLRRLGEALSDGRLSLGMQLCAAMLCLKDELRIPVAIQIFADVEAFEFASLLKLREKPARHVRFDACVKNDDVGEEPESTQPTNKNTEILERFDKLETTLGKRNSEDFEGEFLRRLGFALVEGRLKPLNLASLTLKLCTELDLPVEIKIFEEDTGFGVHGFCTLFAKTSSTR